MRIALVVGHNSSARGAVRITDGVSEWVWNTQLAEEIKKLSPSEVKIFYRKPNLSYSKQINTVYAETDTWKADVTAELHFNSFSSEAATGTETYYYSKAGKVFADRVQLAMVEALGLRDRGAIQRKEGRGAYSLAVGKAPAILLEPYFGSNPHDCQMADANFNKLASSILTSLWGKPLTAPTPTRSWEDDVMRWYSEFPKRG